MTTSAQPKPPSFARVLFILYVADQDKSTAFYTRVLAQEPALHVPGMTEFCLSTGCRLGLMPEKGIAALLGDALPNPQLAAGIPRAEVYLHVDDPSAFHQRALLGGAREISPLSARTWGDVAAYSLDPDGHVLVFAQPENES